MSTTAGVYMLRPVHAQALDAFRSDPTLGPLLRDGGAAFVASQVAEREAGTGFPFVIEDIRQLVGLCRLGGVGDGVAREVGVWVALPFRGKGHGTFGVRLLLEFAFQNLSLAEVRARATDAAAERVLVKNGFAAGPSPSVHAITKERWRDVLDQPALSRLHPGLRKILDDERAAGNEIVESLLGWPEPQSVFVRLRSPFRVAHALPEGVRFWQLDDPHWWRSEYGTDSPPHILAC